MKNKSKTPAKEQTKEKANAFLNKKFILTALIINLALRLYIAYQPFEFIDGPMILDDAYYSLTIARNIADGLGPLYTDQYTNGFQPLHVFILTPVFLIFKNDVFAPVRTALVIASIIDTLTLLLLIQIFSKYSRSVHTFIVLCILWIFNFYIITTTLNGLETALAMFLIVASYFYYQKLRKDNTLRNQISLGLVLGLSALARVDSLLLAAAIILYLVYADRKEKTELNLIIRKIVVVSIAGILIYLPWAIYSYVYTGDVFQISGKALRLISVAEVNEQPDFDNWYSLLLLAAGKIILFKNLIPLCFVVVNILIISLLNKHNKKKSLFNNLSSANVLLAFCILLVLAYVFYIFGYWYYYRYFYPFMILLLLLSVISFDYLNCISLKQTTLDGLKTLLIIGIFITTVTDSNFRNLFYDANKTNTGFMNLGLWINKSFKAGAIVGVTQSGAAGYFARNVKIINLDGLVNKSCYEAYKEKRYIEYIRDKKIEYIVGWPSNIRFIQQRSTNFKNEDIIPIGKIQEFKSQNVQWIIVQIKY